MCRERKCSLWRGARPHGAAVGKFYLTRDEQPILTAALSLLSFPCAPPSHGMLKKTLSRGIV